MPTDLEPVERFVPPTAAQKQDWIKQTQYVLSEEVCASAGWKFPALSENQKVLRNERFAYVGPLTVCQQRWIAQEMIEDDTLQQHGAAYKGKVRSVNPDNSIDFNCLEQYIAQHSPHVHHALPR